MPEPLERDSSCFDCYWPNLNMSEGNSGSPSSCFDANCWVDTAFQTEDLYSLCDANDGCCEDDQCHTECTPKCATICDGFVDCDASTICSEPHCDEDACNTVSTACFDRSCIADDLQQIQNTTGPVLTNNDGSIHWGRLATETSSCSGNINSSNPGTGDESFGYHFHVQPSESTLSSHASLPKRNFELSDFDTPRSLLGSSNLSYTPAHSIHPPTADTQYSANGHYHGQQLCFHTAPSGYSDDRSFGDPLWAAACNNTLVSHHHQTIYNSAYCSGNTLPTTSSSTRTTPGLSIDSSPSGTPSGRQLSISSPLTLSSSVLSYELHVCKWIDVETKAVCGVSFLDAGELQEHLATEHADQTRGKECQGYYCHWEGCHRPDEPFSQKSKLQGHFLTHSNCKPIPCCALSRSKMLISNTDKNFRCSVCGKSFARQATLERHERSHRGDKPYKCNECGKSFTDSSELSKLLSIYCWKFKILTG